MSAAERLVTPREIELLAGGIRRYLDWQAEHDRLREQGRQARRRKRETEAAEREDVA